MTSNDPAVELYSAHKLDYVPLPIITPSVFFLILLVFLIFPFMVLRFKVCDKHCVLYIIIEKSDNFN